MNKHTPGPWHAALGEKLITDVYAIGDNKQRVFIAECATQRDALLIAAAPAMYEALQNIVEGLTDEITRIIEGNKPDTARLDYLANKAGQAIAQAEGKP